jgi:hypothetical protein
MFRGARVNQSIVVRVVIYFHFYVRWMYFTKSTTASQILEKCELDGNERHFLFDGHEINDIAIGRYIEVSNVVNPSNYFELNNIIILMFSVNRM